MSPAPADASTSPVSGSANEVSVQSAANGPAADSAPQTTTGLELLLAIEGRAREAKSEKELQFLIVNETRKLIGARQIFLLQINNQDRYHVKAVSSLAVADRDTPFLRWIEAIVGKASEEADLTQPFDFMLPGYADPNAEETASYPFRAFLWQPLKLRDGSVFAGLLLARESAWVEDTRRVSSRVGRTYGHAWSALKGSDALRPKALRRQLTLGLLLLLTILFGFVQVPLTTLAPAEVVAKNPFQIAAPIDGVLEKVASDPNKSVSKGDVLFTYEDTTLKNKYRLAEREVGIAAADFRRTQQGAFSNEEARHRISITLAEYLLKMTEREYAKDLLSRAVVKAPKAGLLLYSGKDDWEGRPISTGEKIMQIADPDKVWLKIELPVADSIVLKENARVRVFLDSDPLVSVTARIKRASYHAEAVSADKLAYELYADFTESNFKPPLIGARGTAQVFGETVSFAFFLFRRPISYARQYLGL